MPFFHRVVLGLKGGIPVFARIFSCQWLMLSVHQFSSVVEKGVGKKMEYNRKPQLTPHSLSTSIFQPLEFREHFFRNSNGSNLTDFYLLAVVELIENITHIVITHSSNGIIFPRWSWSIISGPYLRNSIIRTGKYLKWKVAKLSGLELMGRRFCPYFVFTNVSSFGRDKSAGWKIKRSDAVHATLVDLSCSRLQSKVSVLFSLFNES